MLAPFYTIDWQASNPISSYEPIASSVDSNEKNRAGGVGFSDGPSEKASSDMTVTVLL